MIALEVFVSGIVQGVGFRYFTKKIARELGVKGYVKNLSDGRVYIYAVGDEIILDKFISAIKIGPPSASVRDVEIKKSTPRNCETFEVVY